MLGCSGGKAMNGIMSLQWSTKRATLLFLYPVPKLEFGNMPHVMDENLHFCGVVC